MTTSNQIEFTKELVIERYKFIQDKQKHLDSILHTNIGMIIKLLIALFGLAVTGLLLYKKTPEVISPKDLVILFQLSSLLTSFVSAFFLLMTISNIFAWFGYRKDEVNLLEQFGGSFRREMPQKRSFYTWQETGFIVTLIIILFACYITWARSAEFVHYLIQ
ncbi:hypothetical protein [Photobacterium leiognathi]|uniref:hypothetical protein n=1 Tax=Photobacterium leiognathi TaxID=553611 RepID=UPI002982A370|nr:hypothetical protein [Photobacterium leiognathi]